MDAYSGGGRMIIDLTTIGKVKQCPLCGNNRPINLVIESHPYYQNYRISCGECHATTGNCNSPEKAIEAWNRRAKE